MLTKIKKCATRIRYLLNFMCYVINIRHYGRKGCINMVKIMLVDDSRFMLTYITNIIEKLGHKVIGTAQNGREAIYQYIKLKPDLVFMDVIMNDMSGITAVEKIMELDRNAYIVMCSTMGQEIIVSESLQAGAKDFITKPFKTNEIRETIERYINRHGFIF